MGDGTLDSPSIAWLAAGTAVLALLVATALAVLMPRDARIPHQRLCHKRLHPSPNR
jgi:ABC-type Fe3+ transport system permease subunit